MRRGIKGSRAGLLAAIASVGSLSWAGVHPPIALAVTPPGRPPATTPPVMGPADAEGDYKRAVEGLTRAYAKGTRPALGSVTFARLNWVERTALLNVVCAAEAPGRCLEALALGLTDNALVVRDHAFRILLALPVASGARREAAARAILEDDRNYRKGQGLWIVDRARKFLEGEKKPATTSLRADTSR